MNASRAARLFIQRFVPLNTHAYQTAGGWEIGYGHRGTGREPYISPSDHITVGRAGELHVRGIHNSIENLRSLFQSAHTLWSTIADDVRFHKFINGLLVVFSVIGLLMLGIMMMKGMK